MGIPMLLVGFVLLGALGVYVAMPRGRMNLAGAGWLLLAATAGAFAGLVTPLLAGARGKGWFIAASVIAILSGARVITHRRPVYSALYFILVVFSVAAMMVLADAEFLAASLLIIYAGAILVTYVFVIMLAQRPTETTWDLNTHDPLIGCTAGFALLAVLTGKLFGPGGETVAPVDRFPGGVAEIGTRLLSHYVVGLEVAGILLLAAMVGAIAIARRRTEPE